MNISPFKYLGDLMSVGEAADKKARAFIFASLFGLNCWQAYSNSEGKIDQAVECATKEAKLEAKLEAKEVEVKRLSDMVIEMSRTTGEAKGEAALLKTINGIGEQSKRNSEAITKIEKAVGSTK